MINRTQRQRHTIRLIAGAALLGVLLAALLFVQREEPAPDFEALTAGPERKKAFFNYFTPLIEQANASISRQRQALETIAEQDELTQRSERQVQRLARDYGIEPGQQSTAELLDATLKRVDGLPVSLVLAQAAKESGWGTSRFAIQANNYFGQRCWTRGCGIKPEQRPTGARFEVASFDSAYDSLEAYLRNLNTHHEYEDLRNYRAALRSRDERPSGVGLADYLGTYSEREAVYREEIKNIIIANRLEPTPP